MAAFPVYFAAAITTHKTSKIVIYIIGDKVLYFTPVRHLHAGFHYRQHTVLPCLDRADASISFISRSCSDMWSDLIKTASPCTPALQHAGISGKYSTVLFAADFYYLSVFDVRIIQDIKPQKSEPLCEPAEHGISYEFHQYSISSVNSASREYCKDNKFL